MLIKKVIFLSLIMTYGFSGFSDTLIKKRWYTQDDAKQGKILFLKNCSSCHGEKAEKTVVWKKTLKDGSYPPPPLNGTAHAWHHPKSQLKRIISKGGAQYDGKMPPFGSILTNKEEDFVIAYFQNFWSDEIYERWIKGGGLSR